MADRAAYELFGKQNLIFPIKPEEPARAHCPRAKMNTTTTTTTTKTTAAAARGAGRRCPPRRTGLPSSLRAAARARATSGEGGTKNIATLPGDGIGPEIMNVAVKVLETVAEGEGVDLRFGEHAIGGDAIDKTGVPLPDETLRACKASDSVLLAAIGGYKWDNLSSKQRPEGGLLQLRAGLDCFANLRPAILQNELLEGSPLKPEIIKGVDIMIVRELVGGIYFGEPRGFEDRDGERAGYNTMVYKKSEVERIARVAFEIAKQRKGRIVSVDKANVLEVSQLWRQTVADAFEADGCEKDGLSLANMYVDNCAMQLCSNPSQFDVILTGNIFGDILSDQASVITGSLGMLPSASVSSPGQPGIYEPVHGSAPDIAGQDIANPLGMVLSAAMMCRYGLNEPEMADIIEDAVADVLAKGYRTGDLMNASPDGAELTQVGCTQMGDLLLESIAEEEIKLSFMPK